MDSIEVGAGTTGATILRAELLPTPEAAVALPTDATDSTGGPSSSSEPETEVASVEPDSEGPHPTPSEKSPDPVVAIVRFAVAELELGSIVE